MSFKRFILSDEAQTKLTDIAYSTENEYVRASAIKKLNKQEVLTDLANNASEPFIRREAVKRLNDKKIISFIAQFDIDPSVRIAAIKMISDEIILEKISITDDIPEVRESAVKRLGKSCQDVFAEIASMDTNWVVRYAAIWKLEKNSEEDSFLARILRNEANEDVRRAIIEKIENQNLLAKVALTDPSQKVRLFASQKIRVGEQLEHIAKTSNDPKVREIVVREITDDEVLRIIAKTDTACWVRDTAVNGLSQKDINQPTLFQIATHDEDENVRYSAIRHLVDENLLTRVILENKFIDSTIIAIQNLRNIDLLVSLRLTAPIILQTRIIDSLQKLNEY